MSMLPCTVVIIQNDIKLFFFGLFVKIYESREGKRFPELRFTLHIETEEAINIP